MYLVNLDLSFSGLPRKFWFPFQRDYSQKFACDSISRAIELAKTECSAPKLESAVKLLFCSLFDIVVDNSISGVVMSARYTVFNSSAFHVSHSFQQFSLRVRQPLPVQRQKPH